MTEPEIQPQVPPVPPAKRTAVGTDDPDERRRLLARFLAALNRVRWLGR